MWKSILSPKHLSPTVATMMIVLVGIAFGFMPLFAKTLSNAGLASPAEAKRLSLGPYYLPQRK